MKLLGLNLKFAVIIIILVVLLGGFIAWWYWTPSVEAPVDEGSGLGSELYENAQNPLNDQLPETNPFDASTNPFEKTETNPFKSNYNNPF